MNRQIQRERTRATAVRSSVGFQAVALAASTGVAQLIVAVLYIWCARMAGPEIFGGLVASIALGTVAVGFYDFGTNSYWAREVATGRMSTELLGLRMTSKVAYAALLAGCVVLACLWLFPGNLIWVAAPIAFSTLLNQTFQVSLRGRARGDLVSLSILLDRLVALLAFGVTLLCGLPIVHCLWLSLSLGSLCAALTGWLLTPADSRPAFKLRLNSNPWKAAGHYGLANVAFSGQSLDIPLLTAFGGAAAAGNYGAVARWTQPMGLLANAFSSAAAPHMANANSGAEAWRHIRRSLWLPALAMIVCFGIVGGAPALVPLLIGEAYSDSVVVLQILAFGTVPAIANQPLFVFLQARGLDKPVSFLAMANVAVQLVLVAVLSAQVGAAGAALAAASSQIVMLAGLTIIVTSNRNRISNRGTNVKARS